MTKYKVTDILERNLVHEAQELDMEDKVKKIRAKTSHMQRLEYLFNDCRVSFKIWTPRDGVSTKLWVLS